MRLEQARIYGPRPTFDPLQALRDERDQQFEAARVEREQRRADRDELIRDLRAEGHSLARIALRVGVSKTQVHNTLKAAS